MKYIPEYESAEYFEEERELQNMKDGSLHTFANVSDLFKKAANKKIYVKLSNGYFAPISKKDINHISKNMSANDVKFCGNIEGQSDWFLQIELL